MHITLLIARMEWGLILVLLVAQVVLSVVADRVPPGPSSPLVSVVGRLLWVISLLGVGFTVLGEPLAISPLHLWWAIPGFLSGWWLHERY